MSPLHDRMLPRPHFLWQQITQELNTTTNYFSQVSFMTRPYDQKITRPRLWAPHFNRWMVDAIALLAFLGRGVYRDQKIEDHNYLSQVRFAKPFDNKITHPQEFWTSNSNRFGCCNISLLNFLGRGDYGDRKIEEHIIQVTRSPTQEFRLRIPVGSIHATLYS